MRHVDTLYVGWQDRASRLWFPVGRLGLDDEDRYVFDYLRGARVARRKTEFRGIAQFPDFEESYRSEELFPFFRNRVKSSRREDSEEELRRLGLAEPDVALRPFDILSRSYGRRVTDRFEIYPPPRIEEGAVELTFFTRGVRHLDTETADRWQSGQEPDEPFRLVSEADNEYDPDALRIVDADGCDMGYLPRYYTTSFTKLLDGDVDYSLILRQFNPDPSYPQHRFLLDFTAEAPEGWIFPQSNLYEVIFSSTYRAESGIRRV